MSKHKKAKYSQTQLKLHNKAGYAPQAPKVGSTDQNQYRTRR